MRAVDRLDRRGAGIEVEAEVGAEVAARERKGAAPDDDPNDVAPRQTCLRCRRPASHCYCAHLPCLETKTRVLFLQHPRERDVAIGTARMAHLSLAGSVLVEGIHLDEHPAVNGVLDGVPAGEAAVLFPGEDARPLEEWLAAPPRVLVVLDGTWWQAKKLLKLNPRVAALPRLSYRPPAPGNYRIRKEPSDEHLATIEAVAAVVGALEGDPARFQALLRPFEVMVDRQIEAARAHTGAPPRRRVRRRPSSALTELVRLREDPAAAVIVYGEANSHPKGSRTPGVPELIHLVASRPATGERFEAVLAPRRPLGDDVTRHIGVDAATLLAGEPAALALARFRAFVGEGAQLCAWGPYARDLLVREGEPSRGFVDLRALTARTLGRSAGGIPGAAVAFDVVPAGAGRGRAGRMLLLLEGVFAALLARAPRPHAGRTALPPAPEECIE